MKYSLAVERLRDLINQMKIENQNERLKTYAAVDKILQELKAKNGCTHTGVLHENSRRLLFSCEVLCGLENDGHDEAHHLSLAYGAVNAISDFYKD